MIEDWRDLVRERQALLADNVMLREEIERLEHLAIDLMSLLEEMPVKHPQQAERRAALRLRFDVQQTTEGK
jgi:hypothetical protein